MAKVSILLIALCLGSIACDLVYLNDVNADSKCATVSCDSTENDNCVKWDGTTKVAVHKCKTDMVCDAQPNVASAGNKDVACKKKEEVKNTKVGGEACEKDDDCMQYKWYDADNKE